MGYADKISREVEALPREQQAEVLAFVVHLKQRKSAFPVPTEEQSRRRDELLALFRRHTVDLAGFVFDREEANARH